MDIVVKGRRTEVADRFREHVREKLARLGRLDPKAFRVDVEVCHEANPRLAASSERIELTLYSRGPVVRAEAAAQDPYAALDVASAKLEERLRRAADRRHARLHGQLHGGGATPAGGPVPGSESPALLNGSIAAGQATESGAAGVVPPREGSSEDSTAVDPAEGDVVMAAGPLVVREKVHRAAPMTLDEALHQMELVGHDFYLFFDVTTNLPSVVYRRRGYSYGVLRLETEQVPSLTTG